VQRSWLRRRDVHDRRNCRQAAPVWIYDIDARGRHGLEPAEGIKAIEPRFAYVITGGSVFREARVITDLKAIARKHFAKRPAACGKQGAKRIEESVFEEDAICDAALVGV